MSEYKRMEDMDPQETKEWLDSMASVLEHEGPERAHFLLERLVRYVRRRGVYLPFDATTSYINTISAFQEKKSPGDPELEHVIRSIVRWNAVVQVLRAGDKHLELGGHIASYQSAATLYDVGFNHFWRGPTDKQDGDLIFFQGHSAPGFYARAFLEGRITEEQMDNFRQETHGNGLSSYPHPWLLPNFWQFPTVSMGLGPMMAIYQARLLKYLESRNLLETKDRKVWCFCGDGEMDEPESKGSITLASRDGLDNLIFVINCNLQRLDGPVRGNGKIIQELEGAFRGAGWNVIKVIWGSRWDALLAQDYTGLLKKRMEEALDGDYQTYKSKDGAYVREHFFGKYPELKNMVANMSDDEIWQLNRGGHDPHKVYAAYWEAVNNANGRPTVILAKTIKGYGMGKAGEGQNIAHQAKKMNLEALKKFRDRFNLPFTDEDIEKKPYYRPAEDSPEMKYMMERRAALGGFVPNRIPSTKPLEIPPLEAFDALLKSSGEREFSTTMAFVRMLGMLMKDKNIGKRIIPIVPDESRTFGMEGMFRQYGIWNPKGQLYTPEDKDQLMFYKESKDGQIFQEGINEAGGMASWMAAASSYANNHYAMIPFFIYYSMFGFQRFGDFAWAAGDMRCRGFLLGGTAGRTTLNGEGLQHQDGHSLVQADLIPNCLSYDPAYAYEVAVIIHDGLKRMYVDQEDVFYYLTVMNENYAHPSLPERKGIKEDILKGIYKLKEDTKHKTKAQILASGIMVNEALAAQEILRDEYDVSADVWSVTSFNLLARDGKEAERVNMLNPGGKRKGSFVEEKLGPTEGPIVASTDYVREYSEKIRAYLPGKKYVTLGTDGFGRSDSRENLRSFFEVDRAHIVIATLGALREEGKVSLGTLKGALERFGIDPKKPAPWKA